MRHIICPAVLLLVTLTASATGQAKQNSEEKTFPSDTDIRKILQDRVDLVAGPEDGVGIVVGLIAPGSRRIVSDGHRDRKDSRALDGDTVFEIGSVSKVFTALLLADMVRTGDVALADPVSKYLPAGVKVPERNGHAITLEQLATHTSGSPFMPDEVPVYNAPAAASASSSAQLYQFLARYQLTRDPGTEWDYSNIGYWLLSQALETRAGMDYESLLCTRVLVPLKMKRTAVVVSPELKRKLAIGHDAALQPAPPFSSVSLYGAMPAAGGLVSSVNDLLTFRSVAMENQKDSPLSQSMSAMLERRRPMDGGEQALGWVVQTEGENRLVMHNGFTWGYASCVAWDPKSHVGVVVLSNQLNGVSDIAFHLLRSSSPLQPPAVARHTEIAIDSKVIDRYAGRYEAPEVGIFDIVRDHNFLTIQLPADWGLPKSRLRPESEHDFFVAELPIRVTFQADASGQAEVLVYPPRGQHAITAHRKLEK